MRQLSPFRHGLALAAMVLTCLSNTSSLARTQSESGQTIDGPRRAGQSRTVLADGRVLLLGGTEGRRIVSDAFIVDPQNQRVTRLPLGMRRARTGHSATVLPDGDVLIFGGVESEGGDVAEILDTKQLIFNKISVDLGNRSNHAATLLTDGRVLFTGGRDENGTVLDTAALWNPDDESTKTLPLQNARSDHQAELQPDGTVLIRAGTSDPSELFVPGADVVVLAGAQDHVPETTYLTGSIPEDGTSDVSVGTRIALRFSHALGLHSLRGDTVRLMEGGRLVETVITLVGDGRLLFIQPTRPLNAGATYVVIAGALASSAGDVIATRSISFTTASPDHPQPIASSDDEEWRPDGSGRWRTGAKRSPWQDLPSLQAADGITALSGQVLRINGTPLADVDLRIGDRSARSDNSGRFLLRLDGLATGRHVLQINGATANRAGRQYGFYEAGVQIVADRTTVLPHTIWMTALDNAHAVTIPSPTTTATVITTPHIPGLELHLPARTVIRDRNGNRVTQVTITPIPVDRPPFPLPAGTEVPIYFTIQPGGSRIYVYGNYGRGAQLYYPNYMSLRAGTRTDFWHYEPEGRGWFIYGGGAVEPSGRQVIPDPGISIYRFTGAMITIFGDPPEEGPPGGPSAGDPVDLATGLFVMQKTDLLLRDVLPLALTRVYRQKDGASRSFGIGSTHAYDLRLWRPSLSNYDGAALILPDGFRITYNRIDGGTGFVDMVLEHTTTPTAFYKSRITWNGSGFDLKLKDGTVLVFGDNAPLQSIRDRLGNTITLVRPTGQGGLISRIVSPNGRWIALTYDTSQRITQATDNIGRTVTYTYDSGRLWKVTDVSGGVTEYTYDTSDRMLTIKDPRAITYLTNTYDTNGRVDTQTLADGGVFQFDYALDGIGKVTQTDVTNPRGFVRRVTFNAKGYHLTDTEALGTSVERTTTLSRQSGSHFVTGIVDELNRETVFAYDGNGKVTSATRLAGTSDAATTAFTYEPAYQQIASITDPLNHTTTFTYDYEGRLTAVTDPLNHQVTFTYDPAGQPLTITNALNKTLTLAYSGGDLVSMTTPLGNVTSLFTDGVGRVIRTIDPRGSITSVEYDALDLVKKVVDRLGGETTFTYDGNGNLLTLTDPRGKATTWTYDDMDQVATQTDALTRQESFTYDLHGYLKTWTDRKGQVTSYTYDPLDRRTFVGFGTTGTPVTYASSVTTTFDAGDRTTSVVDSGAGTISRTFDLLDRVTQEVTPEGTINYTYDAAGRRATMQVAGQTSVLYSYDNADRLTGIEQGSASVSIAYDNANRRSSVTLPNAITVEYAYDDDSRPTGLTYKLEGTTLGGLTYTYDPAGQRIAVGGTYARSSLPPSLTAATYDDANQIASWAGTSFTYDSNGNLTSDGLRSFTWNARNELTAISGALGASFSYDGYGRRRSRTVSSATRQYLYDGLNPAQELGLSGTPIANFLAGLNIDEYIARTDSAGTQHYLFDALGSAVALSDGSGAVQTEYTYEPFGAVVTNGASTGNTLAFTGREADGTGLYFYRARYFDPRLQRFISADPLGFSAGDVNLYGYVWNSPTNFSDPSGESPIVVLPLAGCIGGAVGAGLTSGWHARKIAAGCAGGAIIGLGGWALAPALGGLGAAGGAGGGLGGGLGAGGTLAAASAAAFRAAQNLSQYVVKPKHLPGGPGRDWSKFAPGVDPLRAIGDALTSSGARFLPNANGGFQVITNVGREIGTRGQQAVKVVVTWEGRIITAYPVKQ